MKFIHEGRVITIQSSGDIYSTSEPVLEISHGDNKLFLTSFTFDEIQTVEHGSGEFIATVDHDTHFGLGFVPIKADYRYMALLRNERLRARFLHIPIDYLVHPYRMSLADYFVRAPELSDKAPGTSTSILVISLSLDYMIDDAIPRDEYSDEMLMVDMSQIINDVHLETADYYPKRSQESNALNRVQFGAEMRKIWPSEDNCSRLVRNSHNTLKFAQHFQLVRNSHNTRTTPSACAKLVQNLHNTFKIRTAHAWCKFSSVPPTPL
ncbi:hypothetical protein CK203_099488 [Vitis vinifera]|uniref:Uncharacterized protein n=1 Tax=Vitis vinifera TaxID=29760 RepID=A0A438DV57_VITVI|nr:hypothetical protein CK203_099488 [Vitis vinifera]